jgi:hypothetical protein
MKKHITVKILAAGMSIAAMLMLAVCDNETGTDTCECPNGTAHETKPCCEVVDCNCILWQVRSFTVNGYTVTIEDQTGSASSTELNEIETKLSEISDYILGDIKIIVESGYPYDEVQTRPNNTFAMHIDWLNSNNSGAMGYYLEVAIMGNTWAKASTLDTGNAGVTVTKVG